ncbi:dihydrofolate reductase family protein [Paenibacillus cellulositrophicus]|uniref:dihydrofolate reductase family protein n=1 Tax=Paenibacillus cellulositrophicus TaxID=562959 RepID=UPI00203C5A59|nr:dihydrofolate reductase family protein [Paenibacillus cellulositrophicus]MCM2998389.1 dihydrofolate reductase family protein [Paenibacillus cellulositrophicus]
MGEIILTMQVSLDGIVSDEHLWMTLSREILEDYLDYYQTIDTIIVGRNSYGSLAEYWQQAENSSDALEQAIAKKMNDIPKLVVSHSDVELTWRNSELLLVKDEHSLAEELQARKNAVQRISVESGVKTWQTFIEHGFYDKLWLLVHPVVASQGEQLFALAGQRQSLQLTQTNTYSNGVVGLQYQAANQSGQPF